MEYAKIVVATRELVDQLLSMNTSNRSVKKGVVERYARDILNGHWRLTNQGIGVSKDGVMLDGQHRLLAIKQAGYPPVKLLIVYGLDDDAQRVVDQHAKRSARDIFKLSFNAKVSRLTPAILQVLARMERDAYRDSVWVGSSMTLSIDDMFELFERLSDSIESVCGVIMNDSFFPAPVIASCVHLHSCKIASTQQIEKFLREVYSGENLNRKMPTFHLRNFLINTRKAGAGSIVQCERYEKSKKALEAFVSGKEIGSLRV